jgi:hypothetical protein
MPQGVLAAYTQERAVTVNAAYAANTAFTAVLSPQSGGWSWPLVAGSDNVKNPAIDFSVTSLYDWGVTAVDTSGAGHTLGYMQGDAHHLIDPFYLNTKTGYQTVGSSIAVNNGGPSSSPQTWSYGIYNHVESNDYGSNTGYNIQLTFTCTAPF